MRRTRFMTLLFLVLALAFFGVREFRWALEAPVLGAASRAWINRGPLAPARLAAFARLAEERGDAAGLAFVSLRAHAGTADSRAELAEKAVARDAGLTWVLAHLAQSQREAWLEGSLARRLDPWVSRLQTFDSVNATPWLLEGGMDSRPPG